MFVGCLSVSEIWCAKRPELFVLLQSAWLRFLVLLAHSLQRANLPFLGCPLRPRQAWQEGMDSEAELVLLFA